MRIERRKKKLNVGTITSDVADYCSSLRRTDEPRYRVFRRGKNESMHVGKDTMLRMSAPDGTIKIMSKN